MKEVAVARQLDMSLIGELRSLLIKFVSQNAAYSATMERLGVAQVVHSDNMLKFRGEDFRDFLRVSRFKEDKLNLNEAMLHIGCQTGKLKRTACWELPEHVVAEDLQFARVLVDTHLHDALAAEHVDYEANKPLSRRRI
jgi:hypothetical protein